MELGAWLTSFTGTSKKKFFEILFFNPHSAMHHVGCMAAQNPTWFWAQTAIRN